MRRRSRQGDERGSLSVELAMIAPGILFIFALIFAYGKVGQVNGTLESGTRDAARSATIARSEADARDRATAAVKAALVDSPPACLASVKVDVVGDFEAGDPITVKATCDYPVSDAGLPGAPGTLHAHSTFTSMLDPNRGLD